MNQTNEQTAGKGAEPDVACSAVLGRGRWDEINDRWHSGAKITNDEVGDLLDIAISALLENERLRAEIEQRDAAQQAQVRSFADAVRRALD
jgi:hypothetical protein